MWEYAIVSIRSLAFFCQSGLVVLAGYLVLHINKFTAWQLIFSLLSFMMLALCCLHYYSLPATELAPKKSPQLIKQIIANTKSIALDWMKLPNIILITVFIILFNAADAQLLRVVPLFFMSGTAQGGLALNPIDMGLSQFVAILTFIFGAFALSMSLKAISLKKIRYAMVRCY